MTLYSIINIIILLNLILLGVCQYILIKYCNYNILKIVKYTLEASLIGAIADTYAIFGLFYKIGPHTDILRKKRLELIERTKEFVGNFLLSKEFLDEELKNIEINITKYFNEKELAKIIHKSVNDSINNNKILKLLSQELSEKITELIIKKLVNNDLINKNINSIGKNLIKKVILENHDIIIKLIEKRLNAIDDKEFIKIIKNSSWNELQWIRLNGLILGAFIGLIFGIIETLF